MIVINDRHQSGLIESAWHRFLLNQCELPAPPHFETPSLQQVLRTDRTALDTLHRVPILHQVYSSGLLSLNAALQDIYKDHAQPFVQWIHRSSSHTS